MLDDHFIEIKLITSESGKLYPGGQKETVKGHGV